MAEPARLHDPAVHLGLKAVTGAFTLLAALAAVSAIVETWGDLRYLAVLAVPPLFALLWRATIWRARPLYLDDTWLLVGRGARARRIPLAQIARIDRPGWAYPDTFLAPLELEVRGEPPVLFFPTSGAEVLLRARVHGG
jgi:hypothetical protein